MLMTTTTPLTKTLEKYNDYDICSNDNNNNNNNSNDDNN